ncbi:LacI family DNA-binding transcriptional regulator [Actinacidiphila acididurans]|uniref:LacI family DNA-binding transcriptional regulator n=1 Tax=Actinacidiphila acididurans TaxID=2784346 RepID=A0ABS2TMR5_9ACTN|nr:LacI family DNA-binding transcriptional regulator [Actinacidiphila acididurans]MBM9504357.1 LacI family DNA-binding transcriptional regulator [Actinacidiphila acididurans]
MSTTQQGPSGPTIVQVAQAAGVSRQTVSNALNAPHRLRPGTLARVMAAIDELGYVPNLMARSLRTRYTRQIGYLLDGGGRDPDSVVQDEFLQALCEAAEAEGYLLLLFNYPAGDVETTRWAGLLRTGSVDGFVLRARPDDPRPDLLSRRRAPFVSFGRPPRAGGASGAEAGSGTEEAGTDAAAGPLWVDVDLSAGAEAAVDHLVAAGHRHIAFLGRSPGSAERDEPRLAGWRRAMRKHGLPADACDWAPSTCQDGARGALRLLSAQPAPTAVVAADDMLAMGCYAAAGRLGLAVGRELAVIGFGDSPIASRVTPTLTSVGRPLAHIGEAVMRLLATTLSGRVPEERGVLLAPSVTVRESG